MAPNIAECAEQEPNAEACVASRHCMGTITSGTAGRLLDVEGCRLAVNEILQGFDVIIMGEQVYPFDTGGYSLIVALAESHISIHTWPERGMVQLDVFLCNFLRDNRQRCSDIFAAIVEWFEPEDVKSVVCERL